MNKTAAIIGGGVIGGGWAARFLLNGWDVRVFDPDPDAEAKLAPVLAQARRALPSLTDVALPPEGRLSFHNDLANVVRNVDWVQESVPERVGDQTQGAGKGPGRVSGKRDHWFVYIRLQAQ